MLRATSWLSALLIACSAPAPDTDGPVAVDPDLTSRCAAVAFPLCEDTTPLAREARTVIEAPDPNGAVPGRCDGSDLDVPGAIVLPSDPEAYPVLVRVAGAGFAGECTSCIESVPPYGFTRYGVKVEVPPEIFASTERHFIASVNDPWRIVSGGCGEACAHNCLSHYLEFEPSTCMPPIAEGIGVATDAVDPPVAELVVQIVGRDEFGRCCPLACEGP